LLRNATGLNRYMKRVPTMVVRYSLSMLIVLFCIFTFANAGEVSCAKWMATPYHSEYKTEQKIVESCDDKTFKVFDHEYAKDKNVVYYKPMPNMNNMVVILKAADAKTFKKLIRCDKYADKYHVFQFNKIVHDKDPDLLNEEFDISNSKTYCH